MAPRKPKKPEPAASKGAAVAFPWKKDPKAYAAALRAAIEGLKLRSDRDREELIAWGVYIVDFNYIGAHTRDPSDAPDWLAGDLLLALVEAARDIAAVLGQRDRKTWDTLQRIPATRPDQIVRRKSDGEIVFSEPRGRIDQLALANERFHDLFMTSNFFPTPEQSEMKAQRRAAMQARKESSAAGYIALARHALDRVNLAEIEAQGRRLAGTGKKRGRGKLPAPDVKFVTNLAKVYFRLTGRKPAKSGGRDGKLRAISPFGRFADAVMAIYGAKAQPAAIERAVEAWETLRQKQ